MRAGIGRLEAASSRRRLRPRTGVVDVHFVEGAVDCIDKSLRRYESLEGLFSELCRDSDSLSGAYCLECLSKHRRGQQSSKAKQAPLQIQQRSQSVWVQSV